MTSIDFMIVDDKSERYGMITGMNGIGLVEELTKVSIQRKIVPESRLRLPHRQVNPFPTNAVLYVHGNFNQGYANTTYVREIAPERPDLKFILGLEGARNSESHFANGEDYRFVRGILDKQPHASEPVLVCFDLDFFAAPHPDDETTYWMLTYMQQLKQLRGL